MRRARLASFPRGALVAAMGLWAAASGCANALGLDGYGDAPIDGGAGGTNGRDPTTEGTLAAARQGGPDGDGGAPCTSVGTTVSGPTCAGIGLDAQSEPATDAGAGADHASGKTGDEDGGADASFDGSPEAAPQAEGPRGPSDGGCAVGTTVLSEPACIAIPSFDTAGAVCVKFQVAVVHGWNASNVDGRTVTASGATTEGPVAPVSGSVPNQPGLSAGPDGYVYFNFTAGSMLYAGMACW